MRCHSRGCLHRWGNAVTAAPLLLPLALPLALVVVLQQPLALLLLLVLPLALSLALLLALILSLALACTSFSLRASSLCTAFLPFLVIVMDAMAKKDMVIAMAMAMSFAMTMTMSFAMQLAALFLLFGMANVKI